jgi:hypothetical protein
MFQVTIRRPFGELDLRHQLRFKPHTVLHLGLGQSPLSTLFLRQIGKRASVDELRRSSSASTRDDHDPGKGNDYIEKDTVKYAIGIPEEVFEKAVKEFVDLERTTAWKSKCQHSD